MSNADIKNIVLPIEKSLETLHRVLSKNEKRTNIRLLRKMGKLRRVMWNMRLLTNQLRKFREV